MSQFADQAIRPYLRSIRVSRAWLLVFVALSGVTGWYAPDLTALGGPDALRLPSMVLFPLVLAASVAIHEFGHLLASTQWPLPMTFRWLYVSGSTPRGLHLPGQPRTEILNAFAGPVVSLVVSGAFFAAAVGFEEGSGVRYLLLLGGTTNALVAGINLLPNSPFDGGRVLIAIFAFLNEDQQAGTRFAFVYSQIVAAGTVGFGTFLLARSVDHLVPGLWCVTLGVMVLQASRAELIQSSLIARASSLTAADAITGLNPTVRARASASEAVDILLEQQGNGPGLVRDRDRFVGTITLGMIREVPRARWEETLVRDVMLPLDKVGNSEPNASLLDVLRACDSRQMNALVVRNGKGDVAGLVSAEIDAITLLHRAEDRSVGRTNARSTREPHGRP